MWIDVLFESVTEKDVFVNGVKSTILLFKRKKF